MKVKARELDRKFDAGEDVTRYLDVSRARRPGHEQRRVNVASLPMTQTCHPPSCRPARALGVLGMTQTTLSFRAMSPAGATSRGIPRKDLGAHFLTEIPPMRVDCLDQGHLLPS
jgi:hypothetical protein